MKFISKLVRKACEAIAEHLPLRIIARNDFLGSDVYLERYYICGKAPPYPDSFDERPKPRLEFLPTIYLHHFMRSDEDKELHNHPFAGTAFILAGGYSEERRFLRSDTAEANAKEGRVFDTLEALRHVQGESRYSVMRRTYRPGSINRIAPDTFHRVDLLEEDAWTIFTIGPKVQGWGFWDRFTGEFTPWRDHIARRNAQAAEQRKNAS